MPYRFTQLLVQFLEFYGFQPCSLQTDFRSIFKQEVQRMNPNIKQKEILKLAQLVFHLDGGQLVKKRKAFQKLLESSFISSANKKRIYFIHNQFTQNQLHYYIDENPHLGRACIMLFINGLNLVSIHSHDTAPLPIVHKQYLYQLNSQPSLFEQTLFNALSAEGELYFGRVVKDLEQFKQVVEQAFFNFMPRQLDYFFQNNDEKKLQQSMQMTINIQENEIMATAFKQVNLILNQLWSLLLVSSAMKSHPSFTDL